MQLKRCGRWESWSRARQAPLIASAPLRRHTERPQPACTLLQVPAGPVLQPRLPEGRLATAQESLQHGAAQQAGARRL